MAHQKDQANKLTPPPALQEHADRHVQAYGDSVNITAARQLPRGMGVLIMAAARAIEKYCGTPRAVMILLQAAETMMKKPVKGGRNEGLKN